MWNNGCFGGNSCIWIILIILIFCCCGGNNGGDNCGCSNNCGC
ncbi:MAG: hypothetical protein ACI4Q8_06015 [Ruminococcus sp.]